MTATSRRALLNLLACRLIQTALDTRIIKGGGWYYVEKPR